MFDHILNTFMKSSDFYGEPNSPKNKEGQYQSQDEDQEDEAEDLVSEFADNVLLHEVPVAIPFQCYSITLKHRLIDSLGGVSRFVLTALAQENVTLETIKTITGLSGEHLEPFITRFIRLEWITEDRTLLTYKGRAIAKAILLVDQSTKVWIDSIKNMSGHPLILMSDHQLKSVLPDGVISLTPKKQGKVRNAKDQKERLEKFFLKLDKIQESGPPQKKIIIDDRNFICFLADAFDRERQVIYDNAADWYFELSVNDDEVSYLVAELPKGTEFDSKPSKGDLGVQFSLPCIMCNIKFDQQSKKYFDIPSDKNFYISLYSGALIEDKQILLEEGSGSPLGVHIDNEECKKLLENAFPECSPLVGRTVNLEVGFYSESISITNVLAHAEHDATFWRRFYMDVVEGLS